MRLKKCVLSFLRKEAGARWDLFHVRRQCIPGTWPGDGKGFVSYMKPSTWIDEVAARIGPWPGVVTASDYIGTSRCYNVMGWNRFSRKRHRKSETQWLCRASQFCLEWDGRELEWVVKLVWDWSWIKSRNNWEWGRERKLPDGRGGNEITKCFPAHLWI